MQQTPENNHTKRLERQFDFPASARPPRISTKKEPCHQEMESGVNDQLSQPFGTFHEGPALVSPHPEVSIAKAFKMARSKEGRSYQYQPLCGSKVPNRQLRGGP